VDETRIPERPLEEEAFPGVEVEAPPDDNRPDYLRPDFVWREIVILAPVEQKIETILGTAGVILIWTTILVPSAVVRRYAGILLEWILIVGGAMMTYAAIRRGVPNLWRKGERPYRIAAVITILVSLIMIVYVVIGVIKLLGI